VPYRQKQTRGAAGPRDHRHRQATLGEQATWTF
jgi:hypothetical protein